MSTVTLYSAGGCHLCDAARSGLERLRAGLAFELVEVDIAGDEELERRYRVFIPVVEVDGRRVSIYHLDEDALRGALAASASQTPGSPAAL